jgi:hypothetical protein
MLTLINVVSALIAVLSALIPEPILAPETAIIIVLVVDVLTVVLNFLRQSGAAIARRYPVLGK